MLVIPGGGAPENLRIHDEAVAFSKEFVESGKPVGAICHGAQLLISAKVLKGRQLTCVNKIRDDVINAGGIYVDDPLVEDGNLITSRVPGDLADLQRSTRPGPGRGCRLLGVSMTTVEARPGEDATNGDGRPRPPAGGPGLHLRHGRCPLSGLPSPSRGQRSVQRAGTARAPLHSGHQQLDVVAAAVRREARRDGRRPSRSSRSAPRAPPRATTCWRPLRRTRRSS